MRTIPSKDFALFRRLLVEARPYWGHILLIFGVSVLATPLALVIPLPLKIVVDSVLGEKPLPGFIEVITPQFFHGSTGRMLLLAALLAVLVSLTRQLQGLANTYLQAYTGENLVRAFRAKIFRHEPTRALDIKTEATLMETMERLMQGRTSFTIAHRLSTIKNCDWLLNFDDGRVEAQRVNGQPEKELANEVVA